MAKEVLIDGVKYVPLQEVLINADFFVRKLIALFYGEDWIKEMGYPMKDVMNQLTIHVTEGGNEGNELPTLMDFYNTLAQ